MKRLTLLSIIITISCISFSQTLTPTVQLLNKDTIFCFSISQSKEIAKRIQAGSWCDSILQVQQRWMQLYDQSTEVNDSIVLQLKQKVNNMKALTQNQRVSISLLNKTINLQKKQLKRSKTHKVLLSIGLGIMTTVAVVNTR